MIMVADITWYWSVHGRSHLFDVRSFITKKIEAIQNHGMNATRLYQPDIILTKFQLSTVEGFFLQNMHVHIDLLREKY